MARSKTDLPRMQNPARSRAPLELGLKVASQAAARTEKTQKPAAMMRQYDLIERVRRYNPNTDEALLNRAYVYAMKAHGEQRRASGDPYFSHPLEVAAILTDLKLDDATIAAALLHDTIEDTPTTRAEIDQIFGPDIGHLVEGLTKLKKLDLVSREAKQAENLRKLLLAIADDVRVLLVKFADRLHNMRTLEHMPGEGRSASPRSLRRFSACLASRETRSSRFSLVRPSTRWPMSGPKLVDLGPRRGGVFDRVVSRAAAIVASSSLRSVKIAATLERVGKVRVAGGALLLAVRLHGVDIGAVEQRLVGVRVVAAHPLDQIVLPHHCGRLLRFFGSDSGGEANFKPSSTGARLLAGFCIRGRSVFERAMTRPRPPAAGHLGFGRAPAAFPHTISRGFDAFARPRPESGS